MKKFRLLFEKLNRIFGRVNALLTWMKPIKMNWYRPGPHAQTTWCDFLRYDTSTYLNFAVRIYYTLGWFIYFYELKSILKRKYNLKVTPKVMFIVYFFAIKFSKIGRGSLCSYYAQDKIIDKKIISTIYFQFYLLSFFVFKILALCFKIIYDENKWKVHFLL